MKNKIITIAIILVAILCVVGIISLITNKDKESKENINILDEVCFTFEKETKTIVGYDTVCGLKVGIPETINGVRVENIGTRAFSGLGIESLLLPNTLKIIGISAFENNNIETLIIPDSVENIKPMAFMGNKLTSLKIGKNVSNIGIEAFNNNLLPYDEAYIYYRSDGGENRTILIGYGGKKRDIVILPSQIETIYLSALADNNIKQIELNEGLERIEMNAFSGNLITNITIPSSVNIINDSLDYSLKQITILGKKSVGEFSTFNSNINQSILKFQ